VLIKIAFNRSTEPESFLPVYAFLASPEAFTRARFYFDKNKERSVLRNEVNFPAADRKITLQNFIPFATQKLGCQFFTFIS
jgi:hypothetical protein